MSNETESESAQVSKAPEAVHVIPPAAEAKVTVDYEMKLLHDAVHSLPSLVVKDLLSSGVCIRCIFRLFGIQEHICYRCCLSPLSLCTLLQEPTALKEHSVCNGHRSTEDSSITSKTKEPESEINPEFCTICLGILQFTSCDEKEVLVKKESVNNLAVSIAELAKQEGHEIDSFSLEVSIPPVILENENAVWLYLKKKYGSEDWFEERFVCQRISAKDALKSALTNPLETLLDVKYGLNSFRIRLTYTHSMASKTVHSSSETNQSSKRRKTAPNNDLNSEDIVASGAEHCRVSVSEVTAVAEKSFIGMQDGESFDLTKFAQKKVNKPCRLAILCYRMPICLGGRYLKYSRNVSQTRWIIDDERMGESSVEEIIGSNILPMCQGDSYKFHAAGREDIDVRMLGSGRPFLVEIQNARLVPSKLIVKEIETKINSLQNKLVRVKNLKVVGSQGWNMMREGEAEKQKQYAALVWISRPIEEEDVQSISSLKDLQILQRTPIRVLHRRSPLEREKIIHWMKIERIAGSAQYFLLHLCTQAGTYIKEFVHGDLGRTLPSIGSILQCRAEILQLDVTEVKMDCF